MNVFNNPVNQERLRQIQQDPIGLLRQIGYEVPDDLAADPKAIVMHLMDSGQIRGPLAQRIMPMIRQMGGR